MRRLVLAVAVLASLAVPAAVQADPVTTGRDKLAERVAAECRRAGVRSDAECWAGIGRRVVRAEVDAHERSPLARTLAFQRRLGDVLPLREAPWVGTHNSFNSPAEEPTLSHTDSNQQLTLVEQLRLDVRSLELDVHWVPSQRTGGARAPVVCHGQGQVGCSTERLLGDHLRELLPWLDAHRDDVVLLYLEDQIDDPAGYAATAKLVREVLGARLYAPRGGGCQELPLDLTRRAVREAGAQVVVVGDCGAGTPWEGVSHAWTSKVRFEARPKGWSCEQVPRDGRITRYFEDSTFLAQTPASSRDDGLTPATVRSMTTCGVDLLGFDQLLPGDGRLEATVWSWADGEPAAGDRAATQREDGRWVGVSRTGVRRAACLQGGAWVLSRPTSRSGAWRACRRLGAAWVPPRTGAQNARLAAAGGAGAWLAWRP